MDLILPRTEGLAQRGLVVLHVINVNAGETTDKTWCSVRGMLPSRYMSTNTCLLKHSWTYTAIWLVQFAGLSMPWSLCCGGASRPTCSNLAANHDESDLCLYCYLLAALAETWKLRSICMRDGITANLDNGRLVTMKQNLPSSQHCPLAYTESRCRVLTNNRF